MIRLSLLASTFLVLAIFSGVQAQNPKDGPQVQKFSLGIKAGPSVTFGTYPDKDLRDRFKTEPKFGVGGAFFISFPLKKEYSYLAEAGYALGGRKVSVADGRYINNATYQFATMSMALRKAFDVKLFKNVPTKWFFNVGPNIQYWVNGKGNFGEAKYDIKFNVPPDGDLYTVYITDPNRWLFGLDLGIGGDAPINKRQKVRLELRATFGQTYLGKKTSTTSYATLVWQESLKTNLKSLSFTAAYTLDFDRRAMKMGKSTKDKMIKKRR